MLIRLAIGILGIAVAVPANAQSELEGGFAGALRGCEEWVLNPASWAEGIDPFIATVGLGDKMGLVETVHESALPPRQMRIGNHYWRINSTEDAGYILVVSDRFPMCHITGGGGRDLQPVVEAVLASDEFQSRWQKVRDDPRGSMASTQYQSREEPAFVMVVSRAKEPGQRQDRVQVQVTASMELDD